MEERETSIRDQLKKIAVLEMEKGQEEDMMLDYTLRTIEIVNINDMAQERERLINYNQQYSAKKAEMDKVFETLSKEKAKRDWKKMPLAKAAAGEAKKGDQSARK